MREVGAQIDIHDLLLSQDFDTALDLESWSVALRLVRSAMSRPTSGMVGNVVVEGGKAMEGCGG